MVIIIANFGNDSIALIEWAKQHGVKNVTVLWVDTGWAAPEWSQRIVKAERYVEACAFASVRLIPDYSFAMLVRERKNFPSLQFHWCASFLKGLPILDWLDQYDQDLNAAIWLAKRQEQAVALRNLKALEEENQTYGGRKVEYPLYQTMLAERNQLIAQAGFDLLSTRSLECDPCIYNQQRDFLRLDPEKIQVLQKLETDIGKTMFFQGIQIVMQQIHQETATPFSDMDLGAGDKSLYYQGCGSSFGCGD